MLSTHTPWKVERKSEAELLQKVSLQQKRGAITKSNESNSSSNQQSCRKIIFVLKVPLNK